MSDIVERAEAAICCLLDFYFGIVTELIAELKAASAENARLVNLLRCAKEGCNGDH